MCPSHNWGGIGTLPPCWPMDVPLPKAGGLFASFPKQVVTMKRLVANRSSRRNYPSAAHKSRLPSQLGWPLHTALPCQQSKKPAPQAFLAGTACPSLHHILQPGRPLEQELVTLCLFLTSQRHFQLKMLSSITLLCCHAKSKHHEAPSLPQSSFLLSSGATRNERKHNSPLAPKSMPLSQMVDLNTHLCGSTTQTSSAAVRTPTYLPPLHSHDLSHDKSLAFNCSINHTIDSASQASLH